MYRKVFKVEKEEDLQIKLPDDYLQKEVEVIAFEIKSETSPNEGEVTDFSDAEAFFDKFQIDMSNFKFNRDEANER